MADGPNVNVKIIPVQSRIDIATIIGLLGAFGLIGMALVLGGNAGSFLNFNAALIVIGGTIAVTIMSYSVGEAGKAAKVMGGTFSSNLSDPKDMGMQLLDLASYARAKGVLGLQDFNDKLKHAPFLKRSLMLISDGIDPDDIDRILSQEVEALAVRHEQTVNMLRKAAEVAPAMGLIGTLVGLVQMLAQLDDPASIGPSMAVALLTTFYGALLGTVVLAPLATKLERRSEDEFLLMNLILLASLSIARKENPRRLEMVLNTTLPPQSRVTYFK